MNTQSIKLEVPITSFRQALVYLGQDKLKLFVSVIVASYISSRKPRELYMLCLQRAQFCQWISRYQPFSLYSEQGFMVGLLPILDTMLDLSVESLVEQLPLSHLVQQVLLHRQGEDGALLAMGECCERADWLDVHEQQGLSFDDVTLELDEAVRWSQSFVGA
jgi:EAL and modified HD-GYP domain-containing signal transduction protein